MIGQLLKELMRALARYAGYQMSRPFRRASPAPRVHQQQGTDQKASSALPVPDPGLEARYEELVAWPCYRDNQPSAELTADELYQLWLATRGGHKWTHYFTIYRAVFEARRRDRLRILEIGVLNGSSLKLWKRYFSHPETLIVGVDILEACRVYDAPAEGIRVRIGSQADPAFLAEVVREFGPFDLIIDDGSHHSSHMIASFNHLFLDGLRDDGIYFVEDLHANYWLPWRDSQKSFLDLCKELVELMHAHYRVAGPAELFIEKASDQVESLSVPRITAMIREIRFFDSMVAIYKMPRTHVPYYLRHSSHTEVAEPLAGS